jgi:hypothetical protein
MRKQSLCPTVSSGVNRARICSRVLLALALSLIPFRGLATTVVAPDFDSLVAQADYVVRGFVTAVSAEWRTDAHGQHIISKVSFDVREVIKGTPPSPLVLEMLGGRIGKYQMVVQGTPSFIVGEESILFVHGNGRQFFPLVAIMYGMYPIALDTASGLRLVHRSNGSPLYDVKDVSRPMTAANALGKGAARPLTSAEFAGKIRSSVAQRPNPPPANAN